MYLAHVSGPHVKGCSNKDIPNSLNEITWQTKGFTECVENLLGSKEVAKSNVYLNLLKKIPAIMVMAKGKSDYLLIVETEKQLSELQLVVFDESDITPRDKV